MGFRGIPAVGGQLLQLFAFCHVAISGETRPAKSHLSLPPWVTRPCLAPLCLGSPRQGVVLFTGGFFLFLKAAFAQCRKTILIPVSFPQSVPATMAFHLVLFLMKIFCPVRMLQMLSLTFFHSGNVVNSYVFVFVLLGINELSVVRNFTLSHVH